MTYAADARRIYHHKISPLRRGAYGRAGMGMGRGTSGGMGPGNVPPPYFTTMELAEPRPKLPVMVRWRES